MIHGDRAYQNDMLLGVDCKTLRSQTATSGSGFGFQRRKDNSVTMSEPIAESASVSKHLVIFTTTNCWTPKLPPATARTYFRSAVTFFARGYTHILPMLFREEHGVFFRIFRSKQKPTSSRRGRQFCS